MSGRFGLGGHVVILVRGGNLTGFVNTALAGGILLWDMRRSGEDLLYARVEAGRLRELKNVAAAAGCRFSIREKLGPAFWWRRVMRRRFLAAGLVGALVAVYVLSGFVWSIQVEGNRRVPAGAILQAAASGGLAWGMPRRNLVAGRVEKAVKDRLPQIAWVGVKLEGTGVRLEVVEKALPEPVSEHPADVVAVRDGLVKEVLVTKGRAAVKAGDTVRRGQVLISGVVPRGPGEEPRYVAARGLVRARVWYEGYGAARLVATGRRPAGPVARRYGIKIAGHEIISIGPARNPFPLARTETVIKRFPLWRNIGLPVEMVITRYVKYEQFREVRNLDTARRLAAAKAFFDLESARYPGGTVVDSRISGVGVPGQDNLVRERMQVETLEDIGVEKPL
ncbi:MAG: sporulation protein YqfD [Peptococcaceae bacterium]|jgi:similar to stage IV sporulation protein|nr:sporulation protein YqfD [Peptococcaceae bacterium]